MRSPLPPDLRNVVYRFFKVPPLWILRLPSLTRILKPAMQIQVGLFLSWILKLFCFHFVSSRFLNLIYFLSTVLGTEHYYLMNRYKAWISIMPKYNRFLLWAFWKVVGVKMYLHPFFYDTSLKTFEGQKAAERINYKDKPDTQAHNKMVSFHAIMLAYLLIAF